MKQMPPLRIAVASDDVFAFQFEDSIEKLLAAGATLLFFSPLANADVPADTDALFLSVGTRIITPRAFSKTSLCGRP